MNLPPSFPAARVLITVKTYPLPSNKYQELVCTAGILPNGQWIRIYPIPFRSISHEKQFKKWQWIELDLVRNTGDFRPESYRPASDASNVKPGLIIGTDNAWAERKSIVLKNVWTSMTELIAAAKGEDCVSLATFKPKVIQDFIIEDDDRDWKEQWLAHCDQYDLFDVNLDGTARPRDLVSKVPYKYSYRFLSEGETKPRTLMIEDWEIGALYWNCLKQSDGDEKAANDLVRQKYFDEFLSKKDLFLFLGTTKRFHKMAPNPFVIIGVFYPPTQVDRGQLMLHPL